MLYLWVLKVRGWGGDLNSKPTYSYTLSAKSRHQSRGVAYFVFDGPDPEI